MTKKPPAPETAAKGSIRQASPQSDQALREELAGMMAVLGISRMVDHYSENPQALSEQIFKQFVENPTVQRTINQFTEQVIADAKIQPEARNEVINQVISDYWTERRLALRVPALFKMFLISGEHWCLIPRTRKGFPMRFLTPWLISQVKGYDAFDWTEAQFEGVEGEKRRTVTPKDTAFLAHDALFNNLRGTPPFSALYFSVLRHKRYLDLRERVTRVAAMVTGELNFETIDDAARVLGWKMNPETGAPIPETVNVPEDGTLVVTVGQARFDMKSSANTQGSDVDGKTFKMETTEATRLPEFFNGNGDNVNVATAKVQYPIAVRAIMALRDAFGSALIADLRLLLRRMADAGLIADSWAAKHADGSTVTETPETAEFAFNWPEVSELDFEGLMKTVLDLYDRGLFIPEEVVKASGWEPDDVLPDEIVPPAMAAGAALAPDDDDDEGEEEEGQARKRARARYRVTLSRKDVEDAVRRVLDEEIGAGK